MVAYLLYFVLLKLLELLLEAQVGVGAGSPSPHHVQGVFPAKISDGHDIGNHQCHTPGHPSQAVGLRGHFSPGLGLGPCPWGAGDLGGCCWRVCLPRDGMLIRSRHAGKQSLEHTFIALFALPPGAERLRCPAGILAYLRRFSTSQLYDFPLLLSPSSDIIRFLEQNEITEAHQGSLRLPRSMQHIHLKLC